jgi:hypothetical protein
VPEHVRVRSGDLHASADSQAPQAAGGGVAVHPATADVAEDRPAGAVADGPVDGPPDGRRQRDQHDLGSLAAHAQHSVAMFFAEVGDVGTGCLEDPQAEQTEHGHQGKVTRVAGLAGRGEQGLELQMCEPRGR